MKSDDFTILPTHVAFIMDGNGRWAENRGKSRKIGHYHGVKTLEKVIKSVFELKIPYLTVFAFSTENWNRPKDEVDALMNLIRTYFSDYFIKLCKDGVKVNILGDVTAFPEDILQIINKVQAFCPEKITGTVNVALNYGSRSEIINAVNRAVEKGEKVDETSFSRLLYTADIPDPDLIIRTSGEQRLSNFLLYQAAYSELYFCDTLWPDFDEKELFKALTAYSLRNRRYGKI